MLDDEQTVSASMIGRQLGRYTCLHQLGSGGMAVLYLARRSGAKGFTKVFAVKRVKPKYAKDPNFTYMFMTEAKLSASLDHPNIAQVVDFGQDGLEHFLVMEYVHGPDLRRLLRLSPEGRLPLACALAILMRVCAALHYAHDKSDPAGNALGLVHRDVSPTNVLLSMDGAVKLTDFGIAKAFGQTMSGSTSGVLAGKPGYMSPEQVRCEPLDRRSDVFALGILLYEMTTGHRAFFGDNVFEVLNATQLAEFAPPSRHDPDYPPALEAIVTKALQGEADARFASARQLQLALEDFALDHRLRTSDAVLCDYLETLDISLTDPNDMSLPAVPSGTELRNAEGTAFMISADATVLAAPPLAPPIVHAPEPPRRSRTAWWVGGSVAVAAMAAVGVALASAEPVAEASSNAGAEPSAPARPVASPPTSPPGDLPSAPAAAAKPPEQTPEASDPPAAQAVEPAPARQSPRKRSRKGRKRTTKKGRQPKPSASDVDALTPPSRRH